MFITQTTKKYQWLSLILVVCMLFSFVTEFSVLSAGEENNVYNLKTIEDIIQGIINAKKIELYGTDETLLFDDAFLENAGSSASDWYAFSIGRLGFDDDYTAFLALLRNFVTEKYKESGGLDARKATEWHRISLAVLALGGDPTKFGENADGTEINLIADGTYARPDDALLSAQGINAYIWALITLDSMAYKAPEGTRNEIITEILKKQLDNGAFSLDGKIADVDITGMAIMSLSPYINSEEKYYLEKAGEITVREAVLSAVNYLSAAQNDDGSYSTWGQATSESTATVITALCSIGIDPVNDERFVKNGNSVLDGLMLFQTENGGFSHLVSDSNVNSISSEQALYSLIALYRFYAGYRNLFDFRAEQSDELKAAISSLNSDIIAIQSISVEEKKQAVKELFEAYLAIPVTERSYVFEYPTLAEVMTEMGLENNSEYLSKAMEENENGNGTVIDIFGQGEVELDSNFTHQDIDEYNALPEKITTEYYNTVIKLLENLEKAENFDEYRDVYSDLKKKKEEIEEIKAEIESISAEISEKIYPIDELGILDAKMIDEIYDRALKLSEYDRRQITGYDDLVIAVTEIELNKRLCYLFLAFGIVAFLMLFILVRRIRKRKVEKRMPESDE